MELPQKTKFDEYVKMGLVRSQTKDDLTVYQYTEVTQYDRLWNGPTMLARGIVFDDDGEVVQMWRANGLKCLQVAEGDF